MSIFDFALKDKKDKDKEKAALGSNFGISGGGLSTLLKEQNNIKPSNIDINTQPSFDFALKSDIKTIQQKEQALAKIEETFSTLDKSIETDYKRYQELETQLDDLQIQLQEAPDELKWNLSLKYENLRNEYNRLVDKLKANTEQQKKVYTDYNLIRDSYEQDIAKYNKQIQEQHQTYLDTSRLGGSMRPGEELPKTPEQQLEERFTTPSKETTFGGIMGISKPANLSELPEPAKKVVQAIGGIQGLRVTEPELYQQMRNIEKDISSQERFKNEDWNESANYIVTRIAKANELLTGTPAKETFDDIVSQQEKAKEEGKPFATTGWAWNATEYHIPEEYKKADELARQVEQFSTSGQVGDLLTRAAYGIIIGDLAVNVAKIAFQATPEIWNKIKNKEIYQHYSRDEILDIWNKVDRGIATEKEVELVKTIAQEESVINAIKQGYTVTQTVPRFGMATGTLYSGLPADEIARAIIETGKVTADVVKGLNPVEISQITQQLLNTAPLLANEFLKAVETSGIPETPEIPEIAEIPETIEVPKMPAVTIPKPVMEKLRTEPQFPDIRLKIEEEILPKIDDVIEQEIIRAEIKLPDRPKITQEIIPVVEKTIEETILPRADIKLPDLPAIEREILPKVREVIREELPRKAEIKKPEITLPQVIEQKIDDIVKTELPKIQAKFPNITIPEIQEKIMPEVEQEIKKIVPKTEAKMPEVIIPQEEILNKVEEIVKKELPNLKIEPKLPEVKISEEVKPEVKPMEIEGIKYGKGVTLYHGTKFGYKEFSESKLGQVTNAPSAKEGFFFTDKKSIAEGYAKELGSPKINDLKKKVENLEKIAQRSGLASDWNKYQQALEEYEKVALSKEEIEFEGNIKEATLDMKNPFVKDFKGKAFQEGEAVELMKKAKAEGYDGVIFKNVADAVNTPISDKSVRPEREISNVYAVFDKSQIEIIKPTTEKKAEVKPETIIPQKKTQKVISEIAKAPDPLEKIRAIKEEAQTEVDKMINEMYDYLKATSGKGVDRGLIPTEEGGYKRYAISQNPKWYQELYKSRGRTPTKADLMEEAARILREGSPEDYLYPDENFLKLEAQAEAWEMAEEELENIIDLTEPKVIERVIERVVEKQIKTPKPKQPKSKSIKTQIRDVTGQTLPEKIEIREMDILNYVLRGEARTARQVFKAGKEEGIFQQKEHFEEVIARVKERKAKSEEIKDLRKIIDNVDLKKLRPERKANIEKIINELEPHKMIAKTKSKLTSRLDYVRENPDNQIPQDKLDQLARLNKKPIADLNSDEIKLIKDAILHELKLNSLKNKLIFGNEIKEANEELKIARSNVLKGGKNLKDDPNAIIDSGETEHRSTWQKLKQIWGIDSLNTETICEELDHSDHGIIMKYLYNGIDLGVTDKTEIINEADDWFTKELEGIDISKWSKAFQTKKSNIDFQTIKLKEGILPDGNKTTGKNIRITKGERISFLLHYKNNKNLAHLAQGGFRFADKTSTKYRLTEENIEQIIDSATSEEIKVANVMWKFFNEYIKPKINKASMDLNGFEIATEDNYFPIRTIELDRQRDALKARKTFSDKTLEGMGIFKERTNAKNALIIEDVFNVAAKHLEQTSSYIGLAKPLRYAKFFLEDTKLQENIMKIYGKEYLDSLKNYLKMIEDESTNVENFDKLTMELINKLDTAILGLHIFVGFKQPVSYVVASTEIDAKYLNKGFAMKTNVAEIKKYSPQLRQRFEGHITRELGEISNVGKTRRLFLHKSPINTKLLANIRYMDGLTIGKIWNAVKLEIKDKYPNLSGEEYMQKVTERAEEIIRRTQPTWHPKDRSAIGRSRSVWLKLLTRYTSQRNKNRNILKRAVLRYNRSNKTAGDKINLLKNISIVMVINALLMTAIDELRNKAYGKESRTTVEKVLGTIGNALGTFYFIGDLFSSLISKIQKGTFGGWDTGNIVMNWVDNTIDAIAEIVRTIEQLESKEKYKSGTKKGEEKWKTTIMRALDKSATSLLTVQGIPYDNVKRLLKGALKMKGDKEESKTPLIKPPSGKPPSYTKPKSYSGKPSGKPPGY